MIEEQTTERQTGTLSASDRRGIAIRDREKVQTLVMNGVDKHNIAGGKLHQETGGTENMMHKTQSAVDKASAFVQIPGQTTTGADPGNKRGTVDLGISRIATLQILLRVTKHSQGGSIDTVCTLVRHTKP